MGEIVASVFRGVSLRRMMLWAFGYSVAALAAVAYLTH